MAGRLGGVDVDQHATLAAGIDDLGDGLHRADLVVRPLHVDQRGGVVDGVDQGSGIDPSGAVAPDLHDVTVGGGGQANGGVLHGGQHLPLPAVGRAPAGCGDRFGGAGREHHFPGSSAEAGGHDLPRLFERGPGEHPGFVDPGRIAQR